MSLYNYPTNLTEIFNDINYVTAKDEALSENEADDLYISRDGNELVNVRIQFKNQQIFGNGITLYKNISLKGSNDVTQLIINNSGINEMSLIDISNCSSTSGNIQQQINTNVLSIGNNLTKINTNIADIILVDNKTIENLGKININVADIILVDNKTISNLTKINSNLSLITANTNAISNFNSTISSINSSIAAYTLVSNNNTTKINTNIADLTNINLNFATKTDLTNAINNLIGGAGVTMDTLYELSQLLIDTQSLQDVIDAITNHKINTTLSGITDTENIVFSGTLNNILISELNTLDNMDENIKSKMNSIDSINNLLIAEDILLNAKITTNITNISTNITNITNLTTTKADLTFLNFEILRLTGLINVNISEITNNTNNILANNYNSLIDSINLKADLTFSNQINDKVNINTDKLQNFNFDNDTVLKISSICNNNPLNYVNAFTFSQDVNLIHNSNQYLYTNFFREKSLTVNANVTIQQYANTYIRQTYNTNILGNVLNSCSLYVGTSDIGSNKNYSILSNGVCKFDELECDIITGTTMTNINSDIGLRTLQSDYDLNNISLNSNINSRTLTTDYDLNNISLNSNINSRTLQTDFETLQSNVTNNNNKLNSVSEGNNSVSITPIFDTTYNTSKWAILFYLQQQITILPSSTVEYIFASMFRPSVIDVQSNNIIKNYHTLMIQQPSDPSKITIGTNSRVLEACNLRLYQTSFAESNYALIATGDSKIENIECDNIITSKYPTIEYINEPEPAYGILPLWMNSDSIIITDVNNNYTKSLNLKLSCNVRNNSTVNCVIHKIRLVIWNSDVTTQLLIIDTDVNLVTAAPNIDSIFIDAVEYDIPDSVLIGSETLVLKIYTYCDTNSSFNQYIKWNIDSNPNNYDYTYSPTFQTENTGHLQLGNVMINKLICKNQPTIRAHIVFFADNNNGGALTVHLSNNLTVSTDTNGKLILQFVNDFPINKFYSVECQGMFKNSEENEQILQFAVYGKSLTQFRIKQFRQNTITTYHSDVDSGHTTINIFW